MLKRWNENLLVKACMGAAVFVGLGVAQIGMAADGPKPLTESRAKTRDVKLSEDGTLRLRLVDAEGKGIPRTAVRVRSSAGIESKAETNSEGEAVFTGLRSGVHTVSTNSGVEVVRLWTAATAPPNAIESLAVVLKDGELVRGQALPLLGAGGASMAPATVVSVAAGGVAGYSYIETTNLQGDNKDLKSAMHQMEAQLNALASP